MRCGSSSWTGCGTINFDGTAPCESSPRPQHRIDQRGLPRLHLGDGADERALDVLRVGDRAFAIPAVAARDGGEVGLGAGDVLADMGARDVRIAQVRDVDLVLPVVV